MTRHSPTNCSICGSSGAFTGASANGKTGLIQAANTGTLFLD
ncbi:sigma 54-interacting transcriptional regulator, partial [Shigella sonnei]